jgi:hypothetical protein
MALTELHIKKFISTGNAVNVDFGFIPGYAEVINASATADEVYKLEYYNQFGDAQELWHYIIANDGGSDVTTPVKKASAGYLSEYNSTSVGKQKICTFDDTGGAAVDLITCATVSEVPANGDVVKFVESGGLPTNLDELTSYYVIDSEVYGSGTFRVSTTTPQKGDAQSAVDFGSDGTPTNYFINESRLEPVVSGGKGLTISASFSSDGDVIYVKAYKPETDANEGDSANW